MVEIDPACFFVQYFFQILGLFKSCLFCGDDCFYDFEESAGVSEVD